MRVAMLHFLGGCNPYCFDRAVKAQRHAGERVVAIDHDFFLGNTTVFSATCIFACS